MHANPLFLKGLFSFALAIAPSLLQAGSVTFQAESGTVGTDFTNGVDGAVQYISIATDRINNGNPGSDARVATYSVTFPSAGTYQLYARIRVGAGGYDDDSMFFANSFGAKSSTTDADWITVNNLSASAGYNNSTDVVNGGGTLGTGVWKWINLSQFAGQSGFTVPAGALTQTFQIGARENGLDLNKFVFGTANYSFTVSNLDNGTDGSLNVTMATINPAVGYQMIEGLGGATAFYAGWVTAHPSKQAIFSNAFVGLNVSMLRLGDWYRYQTPMMGFDSAATEIVSNANRVLGHPVPVYMSSWAPPAFLKSNGQVANGGTLITNSDGTFAYDRFAQYWYDSVQAYKSNGVNLTWISLQNEPDWVADYDSCIFHPTEDRVNGTNYASYSKAMDAVYYKLTNLPAPPKILAPEPTHIAYNDLANYAATMNPNNFYGVAYHLYGGNDSDLSSSTNIFPYKPHFMTEFGQDGLIPAATLIHKCMVLGQASGFNFWSLIWPGTGGGLIQIENPWYRNQWTNAPAGTPTQSQGWWHAPSYWAMKHYSYFINPGFRRVSITESDNNISSSAYLSPEGTRLVVVLVNTSGSASSVMGLNIGSFTVGRSQVYQTTGPNTILGSNTFVYLGGLTNAHILPPTSVTTFVLDKAVQVGQASNPSPANGATNLPVNPTLTWTPGSNTVSHALYFGTSSNTVANATPASAEFQGYLTTNRFPTIAQRRGITYYWRVDETSYTSTNQGATWSFTIAPPMPLSPPWQWQDIGAVGVAGSADYTNGTFTVTASGTDVWDTADGFCFAYMPFSGDCSIVARVTDVQNVNAWSKAGVMIRESLNANSAHAYMVVTPGNGVAFQYRTSTGGTSVNNNTSGFSAPYWVKLVRAGSTFTGYYSADGVNWVQYGSMSITMGASVYIGLGVTSHNNSSLCTASFDNVTTPTWPVPTPPAPENLTASIGDTKIILNWSASAGAIRYNVKRSQVNGGPYTNIANVTTTNYTDTTVTNIVTYYYTVSALNAYAESADSAQISARAYAPPEMNLAIAGTNLVFIWPFVPDMLKLQWRTNLTYGDWQTLTVPYPKLISNQWQIKLPLPQDQDTIYYRLIK